MRNSGETEESASAHDSERSDHVALWGPEIAVLIYFATICFAAAGAILWVLVN
jgi:hypothetical protein